MIHTKQLELDAFQYINVELEMCHACFRGQHDWCQGDDFVDMTVFRCDCYCRDPLEPLEPDTPSDDIESYLTEDDL